MDLMGFDILTILLTLVVLFLISWAYEVHKVAKQGLKFIFPFPIFGNNLMAGLNLKHINFVTQDVYKEFPDEKYVAYFNFQNLNILLRDPAIISLVSMTHFDHFVDHYTFIDEKLDPLFFYGLFQLKGERWKDMRTSLTPAFTGSKMKEMMPFIKECSKTLIANINESIEKGNSDIFEAEAKTLMLKCANDAIASCAFGIVTDSFKDPENDFFKMSTEMTQFTSKDTLRFLPIMIAPRLAKFFGLKILQDKHADYYRGIVKEIMDQREKTGVIRRDMIHLLMLAKKGKLQHEGDSTEHEDFTKFYDNVIEKRGIKQNWKEDEVTAQAMLFLFAGLENAATLMNFILYELTVNEDCQKKLRDEIDEYIEANGEDIDYATVNKLKYMDMVVSETLRIWTPAGGIDRLCTKDFELPPTGKNTHGTKVKRGGIVFLPIYAIHMDPKYWKNPKKFDPERFSDENKANIVPNTYIPFGLGPRSCIGNRFVLMECKIFVFYILSNFNLKIIPRTDIPLNINSHMFALKPKNGTWIGFQKRVK